jgi:uncharacterized integral membrane protein
VELWDVTLTFFAVNCVLLFAGIITLPQAVAGFSNESILSIAAMFVVRRKKRKKKKENSM